MTNETRPDGIWPETWQERAAMLCCFALVATLWWIITHRDEFMSLVFRALEWVGQP